MFLINIKVIWSFRTQSFRHFTRLFRFFPVGSRFCFESTVFRTTNEDLSNKDLTNEDSTNKNRLIAHALFDGFDNLFTFDSAAPKKFTISSFCHFFFDYVISSSTADIFLSRRFLAGYFSSTLKKTVYFRNIPCNFKFKASRLLRKEYIIGLWGVCPQQNVQFD